LVLHSRSGGSSGIPLLPRSALRGSLLLPSDRYFNGLLFTRPRGLGRRTWRTGTLGGKAFLSRPAYSKRPVMALGVSMESLDHVSCIIFCRSIVSLCNRFPRASGFRTCAPGLGKLGCCRFRRCSTHEIFGGVALCVRIAHSHRTVATAPQHTSRSNRVGQMAFLRPMRTRGMHAAHCQNCSLGRLRYVPQIPAVFVRAHDSILKRTFLFRSQSEAA